MRIYNISFHGEIRKIVYSYSLFSGAMNKLKWANIRMNICSTSQLLVDDWLVLFVCWFV